MNIDAALVRYVGASAPRGTVKREIALPDGRFISAIIGPRRAGKTTFMLQVMDGMSLPASNKILVNGEDVNLEGVTADELSRIEEAAFRIYRPDRTKEICLFIDEVQNLPSWPRWVRTLHDSGMYKIVVTGSTSELSTLKLPSTLRGRALNTLVLPFSFREFLASKGTDYSSYMPPSKTGEIASLAEEFVEHGGYPAVVLSEGRELKLRVLQELYESVIQRDMIEREGVRRSALLRAFMNAVLGSACRPLSVRSITRWLGSEGLKMGKQTAINYLDSAESVFLILRAYPHSMKPKERRVNPKLYVVDSGLLTLVGADSAKKLENQVFIELIRRGKRVGYWKSRSTAKEVDFVVESDRGKSELIQVAYSLRDPATSIREVDAIVEASDAIGATSLVIVTRDEEKVINERGKTISVVPAWRWFLWPPQRTPD